MTGLNKFQDKERRRARRQFQNNEIAADLFSPKYRPRVMRNKRADRFYEEEIEYNEYDD